MGKCCRLITILLDPWDVEVMARHIRLSGADFLQIFCNYDFGTSSHWPFVWLNHAERGNCAFLLEDGRCSIYEARPRNCRTYPIGRAVRIEDPGETPQIQERLFMVERMEFCLGHEGNRTWTVKEWLKESGACKYYELSDLYLSLVQYATETLNCRAWLSPNTARMLMPLLFMPDLLRKKLAIGEEGMDHETFYRRRLKAVRAVLTEMAATFGCGPLAGTTPGNTEVPLTDRIRQVILEG
ncbi:MAG TPA: YkgJ family cysteine cluster protein [Desulfotomaculum sp.]|nr:YkgJ family cysteine cluster protein [Desulfotomaculum sp.]